MVRTQAVNVLSIIDIPCSFTTWTIQLSLPSPLLLNSRTLTTLFIPVMFSRTLRSALTVPARRPAVQCVPTVSARRTVTTDAASSHAEREHVPESDEEPFDVQLHEESFETYELDPPPYTVQTTKKELKQMYYDMVAVRLVNSSSSFHLEWSVFMTCMNNVNHQTNGNGRRPPLQGKEDPRLLPSLHRPRSCRSRHRARHHKARPPHHRLPLSRLRPYARRHCALHHWRAARSTGRHCIWQGRFYAHVQHRLLWR